MGFSATDFSANLVSPLTLRFRRDRRQVPEDRSQKTEVRSQKTEVRCQVSGKVGVIAYRMKLLLFRQDLQDYQDFFDLEYLSCLSC